MPKIEFRFNLASILLASVLITLGISMALAGGASGGALGDSEKATQSHQSGDRHGGSAPAKSGGPAPTGGRGGIGGEV
jgi:hypothetical protein